MQSQPELQGRLRYKIHVKIIKEKKSPFLKKKITAQFIRGSIENLWTERTKIPCSLGAPVLLISHGESKLVMDHRATLAKGNQKLYIQRKQIWNMN